MIGFADSSYILSGIRKQELIDFLHDCNNQKRNIFVLCDTNTIEYCLPLFQTLFPQTKSASVYCIQSGEAYKTIETATAFWKLLLQQQADKHTVIVNLGGGVITDLGGFAASLFKRGVDFIHVPTTLLAMVDAAIGGKNGVNIDGFKNQSGSIVIPRYVYIDTDFLKSLPHIEKVNGYAEMIKHALVADKLFYKSLSEQRNFEALQIIEKAIAIKQSIVASDPYEINERKLLNFGHTIAHALESMYHLQRQNISHGKAVAVGIIVESYLSCKMGFISEAALNEITGFVQSLFKFDDKDFNVEKLLPFMMADKKNKQGQLRFTLLESIGKGVVDIPVPIAMIEDAFHWFSKQNPGYGI